MLRRALPIALALSAVAAGPAAAKLTASRLSLLSTSISAPASAQRTCSAKLLPAGTPGVVQHRLAMPIGGMLEARLNGPTTGGDWDLAVFNAVTGRMLNGSAAFGSNEVVQHTVTAGDLVTVQACRVSPGAAAVPLTVTDTMVAGTPPRTYVQRLVTIPFRNAKQLDALAKHGIDLNETAKGHSIDALLHSPADAATLRRAGMGFTVKIPDMVAYDRANVRTSSDPVTDVLPSALPSGRRTYRHLIDYQNDMKNLVWANPGTVRPVVLPKKSVQGRTIEGIELAYGVHRTDDGRPTHVEMGLHHVREWPSGEITMEYAFTLIKGAGKSPRIDNLLTNERTFTFPVINPDGLEATQMGADSIPVYDDNGYTSLPLAVVGAGPYRRKNCADTMNVGAGLPCAFYDGVDLNRNYGAFWGGPGSGASPGPTGQTYRGPKPYSEPESAAVHEWSSQNQVMVLNSNHTYAGDMLFQPGFGRANEPGFVMGSKQVPNQVPHQAEMKKLSDDMAKAAGYISEVSYQLYDVTGATEDWNYFAQNTFGYTTESAWQDFHPDYQDGVIDQYLGTLDGPMDKAGTGAAAVSQGLQESFLLAGDAALNPGYHGIIEGDAPPGATLHIDKVFSTSTSFVLPASGAAGPALQIPEHLTSTLTVPASGHYVWHVNPSTRPVVAMAHGTEAWTLTCGSESHDLVVDMGQKVTQDLHC